MSAENNLISVSTLPYFSRHLEKPAASDISGVLAEVTRLNFSILENSPYAIAIISPDTALQLVNPAFVKLTGFSQTDLNGQKAPYPYWPGEKNSSYLQLFHDMLANKDLHSEMQLHTRKHESVWVEVTITQVSEEHSSYFIVNHIDVTERRRMREETEFYVREVTRIQEEERKRIARELHDDTAQSLAYIALELDSLIHNLESTPDILVKRLTNLKHQVDNSLKEVRRFSHELRPGVLDQLGLLPALEMLVDEINARGQLPVKFNVEGPDRRLSNEEEQALFRITQEALSNVRKHSHATQAEVSIGFTRNKIQLAISDNGKGFPPAEVKSALTKGRLGLIGMKERANLIGANLTIKSSPHKGTIIRVELSKTGN